MIFETFQRAFAADQGRCADTRSPTVSSATPGFSELIAAFGGMSFANSIYRVVRPTDIAVWSKRIALGFPEFADRIETFGYDWLGTAFACDHGRLIDGEPGVLMFEPGTGQALEIPANIRSFHNDQLIQNADAALAANSYAKWLMQGRPKPEFLQCVGYKKPLFLGGVDAMRNLEVSDIDVYWHLMGQLIRKTRNLPRGTRVRVKLR